MYVDGLDDLLRVCLKQFAAFSDKVIRLRFGVALIRVPACCMQVTTLRSVESFELRIESEFISQL